VLRLAGEIDRCCKIDSTKRRMRNLVGESCAPLLLTARPTAKITDFTPPPRRLYKKERREGG
jgi:hypothetical protein